MREFPEAVCRDAGNLSCWELLENELEEKKLLRAELTEMVITIGYSSGHSSTSSEYVWPQWELIKHTYCGITVECGCSIAAQIRECLGAHTWIPLKCTLIPTSRNELETHLSHFLFCLKENGILFFEQIRNTSVFISFTHIQMQKPANKISVVLIP